LREDQTHASIDDDSLRAIKDCTAGSVGGVLQVLVGQPFDTVKVRMQTRPGQYRGLLDCVRQTWQEGPLTFYKGTLTPLLGIGACVSVQFLVLEKMKRLAVERNAVLGAHGFTSSQLFLSGAAAGVANSIISGPVEHIRIRLQAQGAGGNTKELFKGPLDCVRRIWRRHGLAGIYRAQSATVLREFGGYGAYFMTYELLVQRAMTTNACRRDQLESWRLCLYGALAGYSMWLSIFPLDVLKSKLQTDGFGEQRRYRSTLHCARNVLSKEGFTGFYRGLLPCLLRAAPANAATFLGFELAMRTLDAI